MRTLVVTSRLPVSRVSGYDLRVAHLVAATPGERHLAVVALAPDTASGAASGAGTTAADGPVVDWASVHRLDDLAHAPSRAARHLRRDDATWWASSRPEALAATARRLTGLVTGLGIDQVVVFGEDLAEVVLAALPRSGAGAGTGARTPVRTVLDVCDSVALTRRRELEATPPAGLRAGLRDRLALARARGLEARLPAAFDVVCTISEQDTAEVVRLAGPAAQVATVPNGVDAAFLGPLGPAGRAREVALWGNLVFGPNQEAVRWFLAEVHAPHLRDAGVAVRLLGPHAPDWLVRLAADDPLVHLEGFVPDLAAALGDTPVFVNPMRTGSGLKNKVLEAFGLGLVVVTTTRGIEAVPGARDGSHVLVADDPARFAAAVLAALDDPDRRGRLRVRAHELLHTHYRWEVVGRQWRGLLNPGGAAEPAAR